VTQFASWSRALPAGPHPDFEVDHLIPLCQISATSAVRTGLA
jgi:hypothetical protein